MDIYNLQTQDALDFYSRLAGLGWDGQIPEIEWIEDRLPVDAVRRFFVDDKHVATITYYVGRAGGTCYRITGKLE